MDLGSLWLLNLQHLGMTLGGVLLLMVLLKIVEQVSARFIAHRLGWKAVLLTGWLGVPVHELSHVAAAWLFGHRIVDMRLFAPDPVSGTLGYVRHSYRRRNPWQLLGSFFIAIAPTVVGLALLGLLLLWIVPSKPLGALAQPLLRILQSGQLGHLPGAVVTAAHDLAIAAWHHRSFLLPLQLYIGICVASHLGPSLADLRGGLPGLLLLVVLLAATAWLLAWQGRSAAAALGLLPPLLLMSLLTIAFLGAYMAVVGLVAWFGGLRTRY